MVQGKGEEALTKNAKHTHPPAGGKKGPRRSDWDRT